MSTVTGILGGSLVLATAQLLLSSRNATTAYGKLATVPAAWLEKFMDAGVAAIPDHSITAPAAAAGSAAPSAAPVSAIPPPSSLPPVSSPTTLSV
jgi:putative intracellular protease/amidase